MLSKKADDKQGASQDAVKQDVQTFVTLSKTETAKNLEPNINQLTKKHKYNQPSILSKN